MTKEELKQELYHYIATQCTAISINTDHRLVYHYDQMEKVGEFIYNLEEKKIEELKKENQDLRDNYDQFKAIAEPERERLQKENAELREKVNILDNCDRLSDVITEAYKYQLTNATDLIKNIIRVTWGEGWNYSLDWKVKAEQFLKEVEK